MDAMIPKLDDAEHESARLDALRRDNILDTPPEVLFDDLATLAASLCDTPIALVTFVAGDREWFKARIGVSIDAAPRATSFGAHTILQPDLAVITDASS